MSRLLSMRLELGTTTDGDGNPSDSDAVIFFADIYDSPEICVNAPGAPQIAARIVELWNAALSHADSSPIEKTEGGA